MGEAGSSVTCSRVVHKTVNGKLLSEDVEEILDATAADLRMEGMEQDEFDRDIARKRLNNEITHEEAVNLILKRVGVAR